MLYDDGESKDKNNVLLSIKDREHQLEIAFQNLALIRGANLLEPTIEDRLKTIFYRMLDSLDNLLDDLRHDAQD